MADRHILARMNKKLIRASGARHYNSKLISFLYELMRDHLPPGKVAEILCNSTEPDVSYCNGFLADYAKFVARELTSKKT